MQRLAWFFWKFIGKVANKTLETLAVLILSVLPSVAFLSHRPIVWPARDCFLSRRLFETNRTPSRIVDPGPADRLRTAPPPSMSELPEPEVFAMMLVGLVLLGFRARRDSSEKFE
jgi:hypothetical protein